MKRRILILFERSLRSNLLLYYDRKALENAVMRRAKRGTLRSKKRLLCKRREGREQTTETELEFVKEEARVEFTCNITSKAKIGHEMSRALHERVEMNQTLGVHFRYLSS